MKRENRTKLKRVLLFAPFDEPFIQIDIKILKQFSKVKVLIGNGITAVAGLLWHEMFCDIVYCWFGSVYSVVAVFWAKFLRKRSVIIIGGVDAAAIPEINYGIWLNPWKAKLLTHGLRNTDRIFVVAPSLKEKIQQLAKYDGRNIEYLPTGYNTDFWNPGEEKEKCILTVAHSNTVTRLKKKGIDFLIMAAGKMEDTPFIIIGVDKELLGLGGLTLPGNVTLLPKMPREKLKEYYQKCKVYCQPSRSEGMPNTLCEAMLCGCIPVGTDVDGIPTAIGDSGFITPAGDIEALVTALENALAMDITYGHKARQRIVKEFPLERRIRRIEKLILSDR